MGGHAAEILMDDRHGALVVWRGSVLLQTRSGQLDPKALTLGQGFAQRAQRAGRPVGFLAVLEPGAPLPSAELRQRQREAVESFGRYELARIAAAILGEDTTASLSRSSGRLLGPGNPRIQRFDTLRPAVSWLAQELTTLAAAHPATAERVRPTDLYEAIEQVRRMPQRHKETP